MKNTAGSWRIRGNGRVVRDAISIKTTSKCLVQQLPVNITRVVQVVVGSGLLEQQKRHFIAFLFFCEFCPNPQDTANSSSQIEVCVCVFAAAAAI